MNRLLGLMLIGSYLGATAYLGDFEELPISARALALGNSLVGSATDATAIYYNPGLTSLISTRQLSLSYGQFYEKGIVKNSFIGFVQPEKNFNYGIGLFSNWISDIQITNVPNPNLPPGPDNQPYVERTVTASDWVLYLNYARKIYNFISLGTNLKFIYRYLGIGYGLGTGFDFGVGLVLSDLTLVGVKAQNLSIAPIYWSNRTTEFIIPKISLGFSHIIPSQTSNLLLTANCEYVIENGQLKTNFGLEYQYKNLWILRGGLMNYVPTFGVGIKYKRLYFDYGFGTQLNQAKLGNIHKLSGGVTF